MKIYNFEQNSSEWFDFRLGKITGSKAKAVFGSPAVQKTIMMEILAEILTGEYVEIPQTEHMKRGTEMEPYAIEAFERETGFKCDKVGCLTFDDDDLVSYSPDRVIYDDYGIIVSGVETKCPMSKTHIKYILDGGVPKDYMYQCFFPFLLSEELESWYFVSYDDRVVSKPLFIATILRSDIESELEEMAIKLDAFKNKLNKEKIKIIL